MSLFKELMEYDPQDFRNRTEIFFAVHPYPSTVVDIMVEANACLGEVLNHLAVLEQDGLVVCHSEVYHEWRLSNAM